MHASLDQQSIFDNVHTSGKPGSSREIYCRIARKCQRVGDNHCHRDAVIVSIKGELRRREIEYAIVETRTVAAEGRSIRICRILIKQYSGVISRVSGRRQLNAGSAGHPDRRSIRQVERNAANAACAWRNNWVRPDR